MVQTIKFSEFANGGDLANSDVTVGLGGGTNTAFNNPWTFLPSGATADRPVPVPEIYYRLRLNTTLQAYEYFNPIALVWTQLGNTSTTNGPFVIYKEDLSLLDSFNLGSLSSGLLKQSVSFGISTPAIATLGTDYYGDGMIGTMRSPSGIEDINGNLVVSFLSALNAVNYIDFLNAATNVAPQITAAGSDLNIPLIVASKGTSPILLYGGMTGTNALNIASGTAYQHFTLFNFPNTPFTRNVEFQDSDGTVAYLSDIPAGSASALTRVNDSNVTVTLNGTPNTALLQDVELQLGWDGQLPLNRGGTEADLTASNGGIVYSTESSMAILPGTATAGQIPRSGANSAPSWSTTTYPATNAINTIMYASSENVLGVITPANRAVMISGNTGVPAMSSSLSDGQIIIGSTVGSPAAANLTAGSGVAIANGANSITISVTGSGTAFTEVTGTSQAMVADGGYITNNAGLVTLTLPAVAALGTTLTVVGKGAGGWRIAQNASQTINIGSSATSVGVSGSVSSTDRFDSVRLVCVTDNTVWVCWGAPQSSGLTIV